MRNQFTVRARTFSCVAVFFAASIASVSHAELTTGGVSWLDPTPYAKPRFFPINVPTEGSVGNKYYVDMSQGSGSTCSQAAPCASITAVSGKPGTSGGPAYIYLKGSGYLNLTGSTLAGAPGSEIVIKPWPNDATPAVMTATGGCSVSNANTIAGSGTHHVVFDGGPDMLFRFVGSGCTSDQNAYTLVVKSNDITLYRVRVNANGSGGPALGPGTGSGTSTANFKFINSELYGATRYYGVYTGGGTGCAAGDTSHSNMEFRSSIFRQIDGRGIQVEPRSDSRGMVIDGNLFHDIGYNNSGTSSISGAIQVADACGGTTSDITISNNLMWGLGGGGVLIFVNVGTDSAFRVLNNTIWGYGKKSPVSLNSHAISCYSDGCNGEVKNNIILAPGNSGINPINRGSGLLTNDNLCESGSSCGSGALSGTATSTFASTSTSSESFLFPQGSAVGGGLALSAVTTDFRGEIRQGSGAVDLGAISASTIVRSMPPTSVTVQ